jgi:hypothetical protein
MIATEEIDAEVQTTHLLEKNATIRRLEEELMHSQQAMFQNRSELLTIVEHQELQSQKQSIIVDRLEAKLTQVQQALTQSREICDVYSDAINCRAPATNYTLFLLERYLLLRVKAIREVKPISFSTVPEFISCFKEQDEKVPYFLCELYFHNFILVKTRNITLAHS